MNVVVPGGWRARVAVVGLLLGTAVVGRAADASAITFHEHVAPILGRHCVGCHGRSGEAPFPLLSYAEARKHAREIVDTTRRGFMPPWLPEPGLAGGFEGEEDRRLTTVDLERLQQWVAQGMPEGEATRPVPAAPELASAGDWPLGPPDLVVRMPRAYTVPAAGKDLYRHFVIPLALERRRFVKAWHFRPHSRAVHHIFLMFDRSGEARRRDALDPEPGFPGMDSPSGVEMPAGQFCSWQPGARPRRTRPGMTWPLDPGTDVVVQMHLQPLGREETLQAEVGFYFTDEAPTLQPSKLALVNFDFDLPAGATSVVVRDEVVVPAEVDLLAVLPHAHYLCRRMEARVQRPDGTTEPLLRIGDWDFNWQGDYAYRRPPRLPAGSRLTMEYTFDNSAGNPRNPHHPPRDVRYGPSTTDEMAELWLQCLAVNPADTAKLRNLAVERTLRDVESANTQRLRRDPDDSAALVNLGRVEMARRRYDEAGKRFAEASARNPRSDEAHYFLGLIHRVRQRPTEAIKEFKQAVAINPSFARALGNLGLLHLAANEIEPAIRYLAEAVRLDPNDALAVSTLGAIRYEQKNYPEALDLLTLAARLDPQDRDTQRYLGLTRRQLDAAPTAAPAKPTP